MYAWKYHKETPCVATFISKKLKCHVSHFIVCLFLFYKTEEQEGGTCPPSGEGWHQWERRSVRERR
jgi:hypothetical protein